MNTSCAKCLSKFFLFLSVICIIILELTDMRPLGSANNAEKINNMMLTLSYSFIGAYIFYLLNNRLPMLYRMSIAKAYVEREMRQLRKLLDLCMLSLYPFFSLVTNATKDDFMKVAGQKDLNEPFLDGSKTILDQLNHSREKIIEISESLMSSYYRAMSDEQIKFVSEMLNCSFVVNGISPINYDLPEEYRENYPNNQWEICENIYDKSQEIERLIAEEENSA